MTAVFNGIGDFFTWTFHIIPPLGNIPNVFFATIIIALLAYWISRLKTLQERHRKDPSYHE